MTEIKSKKEQTLADAFRASIQTPLSRMVYFASHHSSQFVPPDESYSTIARGRLTPCRP
jgi:hypothetical protein